MRWAWAAVATIGGAITGACVDLQAYQCTDDAECRSTVAQGWCEPTGFCSYPDPECDSGRRYSDLAGPHERECVEGGASSGVLSETTEDGEGSTAVSNQPVCGNGVVQGDEECDELDAVDGDGCNTDCVAGGSVRWSAMVGGEVGGDDRLFGLTRLVSGDVVAVGYIQGRSRDVLAVRFTIEGEEVQRVAYDIHGGGDEAESVVQDATGQLYICGLSVDGSITNPWMGLWDAQLDGPPDFDMQLPFGLMGICHDIVHMADEDFVAVGGSGNTAWSYRFSASNIDGGVASSPPGGGGGGESRLRASFQDPEGALWAAGQLGGSGVAYMVPPSGELGTSIFELPETQLQAMAVAGDTMIVGGFRSTVESLADLWISGHGLGGEQRWSFNPTEHLLDDEVEDLALDPAGNIYAIGHVSRDNPDRWVIKLDPEGQVIWERDDYEGSDGIDRGRSIVVLPNGDLMVVAEVTTEAGDLDGWIARLAP
ncbi:MAG: hypothetical protein AAF799_28075 [Myxococcota bacterium]